MPLAYESLPDAGWENPPRLSADDAGKPIPIRRELCPFAIFNLLRTPFTMLSRGHRLQRVQRLHFADKCQPPTTLAPFTTQRRYVP